MAKIKHIALATTDPEKTAAFYKEVFGLKEVGKVASDAAEGFYLTDGNINLAILKFKTDEAAEMGGKPVYSGIHHFGFQVDDLETAAAKLEQAHAHKRRHQIAMGRHRGNVEVKYIGPDNVTIDISQTGWVGTSQER